MGILLQIVQVGEITQSGCFIMVKDEACGSEELYDVGGVEAVDMSRARLPDMRPGDHDAKAGVRHQIEQEVPHKLPWDVLSNLE